MIKPKVVLLIFVSGKIVLTGAKVCDFFTFTLSGVCPFVTVDIASCDSLQASASARMCVFHV